jgi:hypothetical protein
VCVCVFVCVCVRVCVCAFKVQGERKNAGRDREWKIQVSKWIWILFKYCIVKDTRSSQGVQ